MLSSMDTTIVQTGIRMSTALYERLKRNAKRENRSLNSYVVTLLEAVTAPKIPQLSRKEYPIDEDLLQLGKTLAEPAPEEIANDPKLAYLLGK